MIGDPIILSEAEVRCLLLLLNADKAGSVEYKAWQKISAGGVTGLSVVSDLQGEIKRRDDERNRED